MVVALMLGSCAPAVTEEEEEVVTEEEEKKTEEEKEAEEPAEGKEMVQDSLGRTVEKPQYGGKITFARDGPTRGLDDNMGGASSCHLLHYTNEGLLGGNYAKGPTGSNEASWYGNAFEWQGAEGRIAESWEFPDADTIIFNIRQGIRWHNKPPMNGRELVAEDVAKNFRRWFSDGGRYGSKTYMAWYDSVEVPDKWTVILKVHDSPDLRTSSFFRSLTDYMHILPPEVWEQYGDMTYWENVSGTGPYILEDFVYGSSSVLRRNPDYWRNDPLHPDNQLPYMDAVQMIVIQDYSTRLAALRTAKTDWETNILKEGGEGLLKTHPEMKWIKDFRFTADIIYMRTDKEPFSDVRVRRAMSMAIDLEAIAKDYYGGDAEINFFPVVPVPAYMGMYTPIEEMPPETRELFEHNPEKAKQLLAEAGYPDGFKTSIVGWAAYSEILSLYASYLADINIEATIDIKEYSVARSLAKRKYDEMVMDINSMGTPQSFGDFMGEGSGNKSFVNNPYIDERDAEIWLMENIENTDLINKLAKEASLEIIGQAYQLAMPLPKVYTMWWPWVKHYSGEYSPGGSDKFGFAIYPWIDQDLKKEMGY